MKTILAFLTGASISFAITALPQKVMVQTGKVAEICPLIKDASISATSIVPTVVNGPANGTTSLVSAKTFYWKKVRPDTTAAYKGALGFKKMPVTWMTYSPKAGFTGIDSFTYKVSDGTGESETAVCRIKVHPPEPGNMTVLIIVNDLLYGKLKSSVDRVKADLDREGYASRIIPFAFTKTSTDTADVRRIWDTLRAEYDNPNRMMAGTLFIGRLPVASVPGVTSGTLRYDDPYWCMSRYYTDFVKDSLYLLYGDSILTTSDTLYTHGTNAYSRPSFGHGMRHVWAGRIWGQNIFGTGTINDSTNVAFGSESLLVQRMLDANHNYRTGASRYPHQASNYDLFKLTNLKTDRFSEVWTTATPVPYNGMKINGTDTILPIFPPYSFGQAGEYFEYSGHSNAGFFNPTNNGWKWGRLSADSLFNRPFQQRVVLTSSCHTADPGSILPIHLMSKNGGCVLAISTPAFIQTYGYLSIIDTGSVKASMRAELAAGTPWGRAWINSGMPLMQL
ncbi:MAG: hypothetical protein JNL74_17685, partial [Fibrobacteres bacterium]|nr:hypothetical protein [Fibrobacterota bacterium]